MQNEIFENNNKHCVPPEKLHEFAMLINSLVAEKLCRSLYIEISYSEIKVLINVCMGGKKMSWTDEEFSIYLNKVCKDILSTGILPICYENNFGYTCLYTRACVDEDTVTLEINKDCIPLFTALKGIGNDFFGVSSVISTGEI